MDNNHTRLTCFGSPFNSIFGYYACCSRPFPFPGANGPFHYHLLDVFGVYVFRLGLTLFASLTFTGRNPGCLFARTAAILSFQMVYEFSSIYFFRSLLVIPVGINIQFSLKKRSNMVHRFGQNAHGNVNHHTTPQTSQASFGVAIKCLS